MSNRRKVRRKVERTLYQFVDPAVVIPVAAAILAAVLYQQDQPPRFWLPPLAFVVGWCLKAAIIAIKRSLG